MTGSLRISLVDLVRVLLVFWLWSFSVAVADEEQAEWGDWGACSATCGTGQRSREGCKKKFKQGKTCPQGHVQTETEECSSISCSLSSSNVQAGSSLGEKTYTYTAMASSTSSSSSSLASFSSSDKLSTTTKVWSSREEKAAIVMIIAPTSSLMVSTSLSGMMTSSEVLTPTSRPFSTPFNHVLRTSTDASRLLRPAESTYGDLTSSITISLITLSLFSPASSPLPVMTSSSPNKTSPLPGSSSSIFRSSSLTMLSSPVSVSPESPDRNNRDPEKSSTASLVFSSLSASSLAVTSSSLSRASPLPGSSFLIITSPSLIMTSSSVSLTLQSPNRSNQRPYKTSVSSKVFSSATSSSLAMTSSSSSKTSPPPKSSSSIPPSPSLIMTSTSVSITPDPKSPNTNNQKSHKSPYSLRAYFNVAGKDWVLLNHVIKSVWTSTEITCAMFCSRDQRCQSFNFKCTEEYSSQRKNVNTEKYPNCQLSSAKHSTHPRDFLSKEGFCYYHL